MSEYTSYQHRHNFAVWAAARATQRGFTSVHNLKSALESCGIKEFLEEPCGSREFDAYHSTWCNRIQGTLKDLDIEDVSYGRAAKLVNVYLKSMVVLRDLSCDEASYVHPPIDRILLQAVAADPKVSTVHRKKLRNTNWTQLDEQEYFNLISILKEINCGRPFWELERYWNVTTNLS